MNPLHCAFILSVSALVWVLFWLVPITFTHVNLWFLDKELSKIQKELDSHARD